MRDSNYLARKIRLQEIRGEFTTQVEFEADADILTYLDNVQAFLLAVGFHPETVKSGFSEVAALAEYAEEEEG